MLTIKSFFYTILGLVQSHSGPLNDFSKRYIEKIPATHKSIKPINITGNNKVNLKCVCFDGSTLKGVREPNLFSFAWDKPPRHKIEKRTQNKTFQERNKYVLSHITIYLEHDDHKTVDFKGETISLTSQLVKISSFNWT